MYDIYKSNLVASSRNHCLHKGITGYKRERRAYKIIAMPQSRILVGQAVRSKRNIILVVFASCITGSAQPVSIFEVHRAGDAGRV